MFNPQAGRVTQRRASFRRLGSWAGAFSLADLVLANVRATSWLLLRHGDPQASRAKVRTRHDNRVEGKRRYERFRTKAEAQAHELQVNTAKAGGTLTDTRKGGKLRFHDLYEEWIAHIEKVGARGRAPFVARHGCRVQADLRIAHEAPPGAPISRHHHPHSHQ